MKKRNVLAVALACVLCAAGLAACSNGGSAADDDGSAQETTEQATSTEDDAADGAAVSSSSSSSGSSYLTEEFDLSNVGFYAPSHEGTTAGDLRKTADAVYWFWWDDEGDIQVYLNYSSAGSAAAEDVLSANSERIADSSYTGMDTFSLADDIELYVESQETVTIAGVEMAQAQGSVEGTSFEGDALAGTAFCALAFVIDPDEWDSFATDIWIIVMDNTDDQSVPQNELAEAARAVAATMHKIEE